MTQCKGVCDFEYNIKKYTVRKSAGNAYRRDLSKPGWKMPENWKFCTLCRKYFRSDSKFCFCCHAVARSSSRQKKTTEKQMKYIQSMPEYALKLRKGKGNEGMRIDIMQNIDKWNALLYPPQRNVN